MLASAVLVSFGTMLPGGMMQADAASVCTVNTNKLNQRIRGFGGINHPEWTGQDMTDAQRKTAFGNDAGDLGLTVLRVFVNPDSSKWNLALPTAQYATKAGAYVFASPWEPPANLAESGGSNGKLHLPKSNYGAYAKHLNDFGTYMKNNGVDLYSISVQNEPDYASEWTYWSTDEVVDFMANYGDQITSTRLMSAESFQYAPLNASWVPDGGKKFYQKIMANSKAFANCDVFGTHMYGTQRSWMDYPELESCGKEIWMTEVYVPNSDADSANRWPESLQVSENIHNALVVGNMSAYTWWYIRRSYGLMTEDGKISKRGYCMAQYSKFVRPGDVRIDVTEQPADDVLVSAYKHSDTQIEIVAINKGSSDQSQQFAVDGRTITDVDRYRTSANENLAMTADLEHDTSSYWANLPANSVSTFVITLESDGKGVPADPDAPIPAEPIEPDANGYYYHDTFENGTGDWEPRGSSKLTLSGRVPYEGTNALLVQDREAAWNGVQKTLDATTFKAGQSYSFSVCVGNQAEDAPASQTFLLSLQYKDADGETKYDHLDEVTVPKGSYAQLANANYTIPAGASNLILYVETAEGTDNFYIDEAIVAKDGTKIDGPEPPVVVDVIDGDVNFDGVIDVYDLALAKRGVLNGFADANAEAAADVDDSGKAELIDVIQIQKFIHMQIKEFDKVQVPPTTKPTDPPEAPSKAMSMAEFTAQCQAKMVEKEPDASHAEQGGTAYGEIKSGTYYSTTCKRNKPYNILLPAGYDESKKYPVLYVMHGYWENQDRMIIEGNGTMYTRQIIGNAIAAGEAKDMIVVFPYVYSSDTQDACSAMDDFNNAAYDNFINDLTKDLMPHIESTYSVKTGKNNTAITGFSMGGREALLIGMQRSDLFGYVGAICPAPGVTGAFNWDSGKEPYLLMITGGSNDTVVYSNPENYHKNFAGNNVPHIWHYVNGGYHGDNSIHAHLYNFCRFVFQAAD